MLFHVYERFACDRKQSFGCLRGQQPFPADQYQVSLQARPLAEVAHDRPEGALKAAVLQVGTAQGEDRLAHLLVAQG